MDCVSGLCKALKDKVHGTSRNMVLIHPPILPNRHRISQTLLSQNDSYGQVLRLKEHASAARREGGDHLMLATIWAQMLFPTELSSMAQCLMAYQKLYSLPIPSQSETDCSIFGFKMPGIRNGSDNYFMQRKVEVYRQVPDHIQEIKVATLNNQTKHYYWRRIVHEHLRFQWVDAVSLL